MESLSADQADMTTMIKNRKIATTVPSPRSVLRRPAANRIMKDWKRYVTRSTISKIT